jgi:hypothetical protein
VIVRAPVMGIEPAPASGVANGGLAAVCLTAVVLGSSTARAGDADDGGAVPRHVPGNARRLEIALFCR